MIGDRLEIITHGNSDRLNNLSPEGDRYYFE